MPGTAYVLKSESNVSCRKSFDKGDVWTFYTFTVYIFLCQCDINVMPRKSGNRVAARNLLYFRAVREFGIRMAQLSGKLNISLSGINQSVAHDEKIVESCKYKLLK